MDGQRDEQMIGGAQMDERSVAKMEGQIEEQTEGREAAQVDGRIESQMDRITDGRTSRYLHPLLLARD